MSLKKKPILKEEGTKAEPDRNPNVNAALKYNGWGTTRHVLLKYNARDTTGRVLLKYNARGTTGRVLLKYNPQGTTIDAFS